MRHNRRRAIANIPLPELQDAYLDVVDYSESLQRRCAELADNVRVLRQKYASAKAENADLIWNRLVRPDMVLSGLPAVDDGVAESDGFLGPYAVGATLGVGSSAVVREGRDRRTGERVALKIVDKSRAARYKAAKRLNNEVAHTRAVEHPNVARLVDVVHTRTRLYLVLEHGGRDLYGHVGDAADFDGRVADVRLTDLGMSDRYAAGDRGTAFCGSPGFFPPEMVTAPDYDPFKVDVWSVGCVALELLLGRQWFSDRWLPASKLTGDRPEFAEALALALADLGDALRESTLPAEAKGFLERALTEDPADRPTIEDLAGHPWRPKATYDMRR
ncbi:protein kinase [Aureococcus anophagefferens]|nr:protein kinase [Aureococcus anophagefferens]